jgi:hypothetical protein
MLDKKQDRPTIVADLKKKIVVPTIMVHDGEYNDIIGLLIAYYINYYYYYGNDGNKMKIVC